MGIVVSDFSRCVPVSEWETGWAFRVIPVTSASGLLVSRSLRLALTGVLLCAQVHYSTRVGGCLQSGEVVVTAVATSQLVESRIQRSEQYLHHPFVVV